MKIINVPRRYVLEEWGGTETVILETCRSLAAMGHDISIFTSLALTDKKFERIGGIPVKRFRHFYPYFGLSNDIIARLDKKGGNLFSFDLLLALLKERKPDLIHLHTGKRMGSIASTVARIKGIPYVVSLHGGLVDVPQQEAQSWTEPTRGFWEWGKLLGALFGSRHVIDKADAVICVNRAEAKQLAAAYPGKRVEYLPNGVDVKKFAGDRDPDFRRKHGIPQDALLLLTCGRIDPQKNQLFLARLLPEILRINEKAFLLFLGPATSEDYQNKLNQLLQTEPYASRICCMGGRPPGDPDIRNAYQAADVFVLPSVHEPFGIVILEAWAARLPVLASRTGGIPGFVEEGRDGMLFETGSSDDFLKVFAQLSTSHDLRRRLAEQGHQKAQQEYDWQIIARRLERLYLDII